MSTKTRNLSNIDGANVGNPDMNEFTASALETYASDAAFEADHGVGQVGDVYWNTTSKLVRQHNGTAWQNDKTGYETQNDSTTTGSDQDITPNTFNQVIRFTHGSLASIRSIVPTNQTQVDLINGQGAQNILIKNEDLTATAANRIVTGTGTDVTLVPGQSCRLIYDQIGLRWRLSGSLSATGGMSLTDWSTLANNLSISATVGANALTIAMKDKTGADPSVGSPVLIGFRNSTLTNGTYNVRSVNAALSVVVSSGSTLGQASAVAYPVYIYAIDNGGTVELAVSTSLFDTSGVVSTTAEGGAGAADSVNVMYSTTARANVPFRLIGKIISTQATAGTWASAPSLVTTTMLDSPASTLAGTTTGAVPAATTVGEKITWATPPASQNIGTAVQDWTNANIVLTPGVWLIQANIMTTYTTGAVAGNNGNTNVMITDAANSIVQQMDKLLVGYAAGAFAVLSETSLSFSFVASLSVTTTYKIRAQRNDSVGTGTASLQNGAAARSEFFGLRIA